MRKDVWFFVQQQKQNALYENGARTQGQFPGLCRHEEEPNHAGESPQMVSAAPRVHRARRPVHQGYLFSSALFCTPNPPPPPPPKFLEVNFLKNFILAYLKV